MNGHASSGELVDLPLEKLFPKLSPDVQQLAARKPKKADLLRVPLERIQPQLARGAVKISLAEMRQFSPSGLFNPAGGDDARLVDLPIAEVLPSLKPQHLARRPNQKKIELPDGVAPIFGPGGLPVTELRVSTGRPAGPPAKAAPAPMPKTAPPAVEAPKPISLPPVDAPIAAPKLPVNTPAPAPAPTVLAASPAPALPVAAPALSVVPAPAAAPVAAVETKIKAPNLDPSLGGTKPAVNGKFVLPLMDVANHWTASGKDHLSAMYRNTVEIPIEMVELGLKRGKVAFPWKQFKGWIRMGAGASTPELSDEEVIELPLAVVAPRFLEEYKPKKQKRITISAEIPDVFEVHTPAPAAPAPTPPPASTPAAPAPMNEYGEIFGQPEKQNWTLQEIVQECTRFDGVAGALIATPDGLLMASAWPGEVKSEAVAAFLPQMYGRVAQYSKELKLGEPGNFTLLLEDLPVQIFKTGGSFLTVLGRAGENLPKPRLAAVALRLSQQSPR